MPEDMTLKDVEKVYMKIMKSFIDMKLTTAEIAVCVPFIISTIAINAQISDEEFERSLKEMVIIAKSLWEKHQTAVSGGQGG
jgi:hypothetical protein